jgi:hypothetical protein
MSNAELIDFIEKYEKNTGLFIAELKKHIRSGKSRSNKITISDPELKIYDAVQKTIYLLKELTESNPALDMITRIDQAENDLFKAVQKITSLNLQLEIAEEMITNNEIKFTTD